MKPRNATPPTGFATLATYLPSGLSKSPLGIVGLLLATTLSLGCTTTTQPTSGSDTVFSTADANSDAVLDLPEWEQFTDTVFDDADADGDGDLEGDEVEALFSALDVDDDGVLQQDEADVPALDRDGSGEITAEEWDASAVAAALDEDGDGRISRSEYRRRPRRAFETVDANADRRVNRVELDDRTARLTLFRF